MVPEIWGGPKNQAPLVFSFAESPYHGLHVHSPSFGALKATHFISNTPIIAGTGAATNIADSRCMPENAPTTLKPLEIAMTAVPNSQRAAGYSFRKDDVGSFDMRL